MLKPWSQEPTLHFFLIAGIIFALYEFTQSNDENVLEVSQSEIDARIFLQELNSGETASDQQRELITVLFIEEKILVQEALTMDLDNDARIHDMLAQKMRHVLSGDIIQPSQEELFGFYQSNITRYETLTTISVDELVFDSRNPLPAAMQTLLSSGAEAEELLELSEGSASPLPNVNFLDLSNIFDESFATNVFSENLGDWSGPFISNRGQHWLRVTERNEARLTPLSEIEDRVRLDWITQEEDLRLQLQIDKLWDNYSIRIINDTRPE